MRLRYYRLTAKQPVAAIEEAMRKGSYDGGDEPGFLIDAQRREWVRGRFVEPVDWERQVVDPFGRAQAITGRDYRISKFFYRPKTRMLEVEDQPQGFRAFHVALADVVASEVTPVPLLLDLARFASLVEPMPFFQILAVSTDLVTLSSHAACEVRVVGSQSVWEDLAELLGERDYRVKTLTVRFRAGPSIVQTEVSSGGVVRITGASQRLRESLRKKFLDSEVKGASGT
ncbi:hypothetical protein OAX78_00670 [Planctomycetota bacterium]|nr:hypothetical protein [Planctomycetota bacterium]